MAFNIFRLLSYTRDIRAMAKGRYPQRLARKIVYKHAMRGAGWLSRMLGVGR